MNRRSLSLLTLAGLLLLPNGSLAAEEAAPSPSAEPVPAVTASMAADPWTEAGESTAAGASEGPGASAAPSEAPVQPLLEPDFIVGDWELQMLPWRKLHLNGGPLMADATTGPQNADGVPMRPLGPGGRLVYNPTVLAQQGMKRLDTYVRTGDRLHLRQARKYANVLDEIASGNRTRRWQPHRYDLGVHEAGWVNSNSHGLTMSFLSRFYALTDAQERLAAAERLLQAFLRRPDNERWISAVTEAGYVWFEHWPNGRFDHTLNAHLNAMFGLYDYWLVTRSPLAEQYFLGGAQTVRDKLYRFRRKGDLSRYSLSIPDGSLHYHETHIDQLRTLALMTGDAWFARQADFFERDERAWRAANRGGGR